MQAFYNVFTFICLTIWLSGCSSTKISSAWKDPSFQGKKYKNIIVIGIMEGKIRKSLRLSFEEHIVSDLKEMGYKAIGSAEAYGLKSFAGKTEIEIMQILKKDSYDAAITTTLLDVTKEHNYVRGHVDFWPGGIYYSRFGRYYSYWYDRVYTPGYFVTNTNYIIEGNLFDIEDDKIIFTAQTESMDPSTIDNLAHRISKSLLKSMKEKSIL
jgi:hypothetical protein